MQVTRRTRASSKSPLDYGAVEGAGANSAANLVALQACFDAVNAAGGGYIDLPGPGIDFNGQLDLENVENVVVRAGKGVSALGLLTGKASLRYTGTGSTPAIILPSSRSVNWVDVYFEYTSASYTGVFFDYGHSALNYDPRDADFERCGFAGRGSAVNAAAWFDLRKAINGTWRKCTFARADRAVIGATNGYANAIHFDGCWFGATKYHPVLTPGQSWKFTSPTVEPRLDGKAGFIEGDPATFVYGVTVDSPWMGDITVAGEHWIDGKFIGLLVQGGFCGSALGTGSLVKARAGSQGVMVLGGKHEGPNVIDTSDGTVYAVTALGFDATGVTAVVTNPSNVGGLVTLGNKGGDGVHRVGAGLLVQSQLPDAARDDATYGVGLGRLSALPTGFAAAFAQYNAVIAGMPAGSVGISARMNGASEVGLFGGQAATPSVRAAKDYAVFPLGQAVKRTTVADAAYTILVTDYLVAYTSLTAPRTATLPTAVGKTGQVYVLKDEAGAASVSNITLACTGGQTIDGAATKTINTNYGSRRVYSDGANWHEEAS